MELKNKKHFMILFLMICMMIMNFTPAWAETSKRLLVLPFNIHSEKNLSYLQQGIEDMFLSRFSEGGKFALIDRDKARQAAKDLDLTSAADAMDVARKLGADYVVFGSVTVFGERISTDVHLLDVQLNEPIVSFNQLGNSPGEVIDHIDLFAVKVNDKVLGDSVQAKQDVKAYHVAPVPPPLSQRAHWKSKKIKTQIESMAIGDIDGDNANEAVLVGMNNLVVYRYSEGRQQKVAEFKKDGFATFLGVDVADINHNGIEEIFVTRIIQDSGKLSSYVIEWNGKMFVELVKDENWYYRVMTVPNRRGKVLFGQQKGRSDNFKQGIYQLEWKENGYEPASHEPLPKKMILYGFTYGDVLNNGQEMIVTLQKDEKIQILDSDGIEGWTSSDRFGGSAVYFEYQSDYFSEDPDYYYLPPRIYVYDLDNDGKQEVVVVKNEYGAGHKVPFLKRFKSGHIESLRWENLGMLQEWRTPDFNGYISDYTFADYDNDGVEELVFSVVELEAGVFSGNGESYIAFLKVR